MIAAQSKIHEEFGGIVPNLAMMEHRKNIDGAVEEALRLSGIGLADIDAVGVTQGPGLEVCLRVGVRKAQVIIGELRKTL